MKICEGDFQKDMAYLHRVLMQAHKYHLEHGVEGCDPRLFWYFPAYKYSLINKWVGTVFLRKVESLLIRLFPVIIRPYQKLCGIPDVVSPYGLALFVQAYCKIYRIHQKEEFLGIAIERARNLIERLIVTSSGNLGVSNPLENEDSINLPAGSEAVYALVDIYDITFDKKYLLLAERLTDSFMTDYAKKESVSGGVCLDYTVSGDGAYVLNANALAAGAMALVANRLENDKYDVLIENIVSYIKRYVSDDSDLPYAGHEDTVSGKGYDVYHTGFTLRGTLNALSRMRNNFEYGCIKAALMAKLSKMRVDFIDKNGFIRESRKRRIIDIHGVAEYIRCLTEVDFQQSDLKVFVRNIKYMSKNGRFYYQRGIRDIDLHMPRWGHAPMMLAIAEVILNNDAQFAFRESIDTSR